MDSWASSVWAAGILLLLLAGCGEAKPAASAVGK